MNIAGVDVPIWVLDWTGSVMVVVSLIYLFGKRITYWHWSNGSLVPYFMLFMTGRQFMLAGLQASYLIFGVHGLLLWRLERRRDHGGSGFREGLWYQIGWVPRRTHNQRGNEVRPQDIRQRELSNRRHAAEHGAEQADHFPVPP